MADHQVYRAIVGVIRSGELEKPFGVQDFREACPGFGEGTYKAFLYKHRQGNPGGQTELFEMVGEGLFELIRPLKYGV
jgi:hypothetical protein